MNKKEEHKGLLEEMFEYLLVVYDNESFGRFCKLYKWNERIGVYDIDRRDRRKKSV